MAKKMWEISRHLEPKHAIAGAVAVSLALLGLHYGGYGSDTTSALTIAVWWLVALGLGFDLLPRQPLSALGVVAASSLLALGGFTVLSVTWADDAGKAYVEAVQMLAIVGVFVAALLFSRRGEGRSWLAGVCVGLGLIVFMALLSRFFPGLGDDRELTAQLGPIVGGRLSWPLGYWNAIGTVTAFFTVLTVWFSASGGLRVTRSIAAAAIPGTFVVLYLCSSRGALVALAAGLVLLIAIGSDRPSMVVSLALGALGGAIPVALATGFHELVHAQPGPEADSQGLTLMLVTVLATGATFAIRYFGDGAIRRIRISRRSGGIGLAVVVTAMIACLFIVDPVEQFDSFTAPPTSAPSLSGEQTYATEHLLGSGGNGRWQLWKSALSAFESEPVVGIGSGGFGSWFKLDGDIWMETIDAHSAPLQILGELGALGFLLLTVFSVTVVVAAISRIRVGSSARRLNTLTQRDSSESPGRPDARDLAVALSVLLTGAVSLSIDWTGEFPVVFIPLLICASLACSGTYSVRQVIPAGKKLTTAIAVVLILISGAAIYAAGRQYVSSTKLESSRNAYDSGRPESALADARDAIDATPWSGAPYSQAAAILYELEMNRDALRYSVKATERAPTNDAMWLQRARIEQAAGEPLAAKASRDKARSLDPKAPIWNKPD